MTRAEISGLAKRAQAKNKKDEAFAFLLRAARRKLCVRGQHIQVEDVLEVQREWEHL